MKDDCVCAECRVGGFLLTATAHRLQDGVAVLLVGGCKTHIGAVSVAAPGRPVETISLPGHRESVVTEPFAQALCSALGVAVTVTGGIHYEAAEPALLEEVVAACQTLLQRILNALSQRCDTCRKEFR